METRVAVGGEQLKLGVLLGVFRTRFRPSGFRKRVTVSSHFWETQLQRRTPLASSSLLNFETPQLNRFRFWHADWLTYRAIAGPLRSWRLRIEHSSELQLVG